MDDLIEAGLATPSPSSAAVSLALLAEFEEPSPQPSPEVTSGVTTPTAEAAPLRSADTTPAWLIEAESMILSADGPAATPPVESDLVGAAPETIFRA